MTDGKPDLKAAYDLKTPADSQKLYRGWAATYDQNFAAAMGYTYPASLAGAYAQFAGSTDAPILDIGAGTGLVAQALAQIGHGPIDGLDISREMLAVARQKGLYRQTIAADLTQRLPLEDCTYGGLVSAGTFTHGHVGPDALDELLRVAKPGALFVLGINAAIYETAGFAKKFATLAIDIRDFELLSRRIYGEAEASGAAHAHVQDMAQLAVFRKR